MKKIVIAFLVLLVAGLIGFSIWRRTAKQTEVADKPGVPVVVLSPWRGEIRRNLYYSGTLEPEAMVTLTPKVAGRIERIDVHEGDWVTEGQLIVEMEDDVVRLQMEQAAGAYRAAEAQYEKAKKGVRSGELENAEALLQQAEKDVASADDNYQRLGKLYKEGTISRSRYDEAERQLSTARTQLENARRSVQMMQEGASNEELDMAESQMKAMQAQYDLAKLGLDYARVTSPLAGQVVKVHTDEGNMAAQTTPLVTIAQSSHIIVKVPVPEKHYGDVRARMASIEALVTPNALPGTELTGFLSAMSPTVDPASRTFTVEIAVPNADGALHAGMYANVALAMERITDALLLPSAALVKRGGKTGAFTVSKGSAAVARFREVRTGLTEGDLVQILEGVSEGDLVVSEGNAFLEDGEAVVPSKAEPPSP